MGVEPTLRCEDHARVGEAGNQAKRHPGDRLHERHMEKGGHRGNGREAGEGSDMSHGDDDRWQHERADRETREIGGCKPESQKFPSENIIREIFECFAIRYGLSCMFWQLNRAVWGFAALLPEINCLPTTLASPGFAGQTEKSGVWAYNPNTGYSCGKMHPNR